MSTRRPPETVIAELKSADFGASFGGSPPEKAKIGGLALPPPTESIPIPKIVRSTEAVVHSYVAEKPPITLRLEKLARTTRERTRTGLLAIADYARDAAGYVARQFDREAVMGLVRTSAEHATKATVVSARAVKNAYVTVKGAIGEGIELATEQQTDASEARSERRVAGGLVPPITTQTDTSEARSERSERRVVKLSVASALRARANLASLPLIELRAGSTITVYPQHEAPAGWVLAQSSDGEIGFLPSDHLS